MLMPEKVISIALMVVIIGLCSTGVDGNRRGNRRRGHSGGAHIAQCEAEEYRCRGPTALCIPNDWKCDNDPDCPEGDDEEGCVTSCSGHEFICRNGNCIPNSWRCDGDPDCPDGSDERLCHSRLESNSQLGPRGRN